MQIIIAPENIVEAESDAMIYSTNTRLALTGGVGAALIKKFGPEIQLKLINQSHGDGTELAEIGDVFSVKTHNMPWKLLIHTVITDGSYIAAPNIVKSAIEQSLDLCLKHGEVETITISELGTGFGSLTSEQFTSIFNSVALDKKYQGFKIIKICKLDVGRQAV